MVQFLTYIYLIFVLVFKTVFPFSLPAKNVTVADTGSLAATDALGRQAVSAGESEKKVGIFYFLWNGEHSQSGPYDVTKIIENDPQAYTSVERWEAAGGGAYAVWHHWGEPLFGYYFQSDRWVVSRHCQMLTDAGVDFMVFDTTNAVPYTERTLELIDIWYGYMQQGRKVPQLAFYTNSASGTIANLLYDTLYNNAELKEKYPDIDKLWFRMNGKPMIVGNADDPEMRAEVKDYFRIKAVQWPTDKKHSDGFPWIEFGTTLHTIGGYYKNSFKDESIMSVSVAQHTDSCRFSASAWYGREDHGRSWHDGKKDTGEGAVLQGYNFAEQWEYAIKLDPDIVFVTGFNEWTAMRLNEPGEPIAFIDNCDTEYSRDVEPSAGILGDNYYMQMVNYIAKFKGSQAVLPKGGSRTVDVDGSFDQWDDGSITAVYKDYQNDTFDRDHRGFGDTYYRDDSGRNDIVNAKVCEDEKNLYFYVDTAEALSPSTDDAWMTLFINTSGKEGYDFYVNRTSPADGKTAVEAVTDDGYRRVGDADIRFEGNRLMLRVGKSLLGFAPGADASLRFKWADNYTDGDIMSFYTRGDAAPYGRMNFVYTGISAAE
ncbi:MAG: hypothetical protein IK118_04065 [Clostridia bacterium]|nr:hypothetical protein [Clostridia bacterium]